MGQPNPHKAKKSILTKYGIYCVVVKSYLTAAVIRSLLMDYGDNPLFRYFVYPWINKDTLLRIRGDYVSVFSQVSSYLGDCCEAVKQTNAFLIQDLFTWEDIRTGNEDAKALCNFLRQRFGLDWLDKADIQKSNSGVLRDKRERTPFRFDSS